jgi:hypothetical protein
MNPSHYRNWNCVPKTPIRYNSSVFVNMTDKPKMLFLLFWREGVDEQKNRFHFFLGQFSFQPIIFFVLVFFFSLFQQIGSENAVRGSWGVDLVNFSPKVHSKVH